METKMCKKCNTEKTYDLFVKNKNNPDGLFSYCKECHRKWRPRKLKPLKTTPTMRECRMCGEMKRFASFDNPRGHYRHSYCVECRRAKGLQANLERYGLTPEQYVEMSDKQGDVCAICKKPEGKKKRLSIDHDHSCCPGLKSCGECIRGLLCSLCNNGLGSFQDDVETLRAAALYLN